MTRLRSVEWVCAGGFALLLISVVLVAKVKSYQAADTLSRHRAMVVQVEVAGAVAKPGIYEVKRGTALRKILFQAKPQPHANLRALDLDSLVDASISLQIEPLDEIVVKVQVDENTLQEMRLPPLSRVCDLRSKIGFSSPVFRSRRLLKDGEIIDLVAQNEKRSYDR